MTTGAKCKLIDAEMFSIFIMSYLIRTPVRQHLVESSSIPEMLHDEVESRVRRRCAWPNSSI